METIKIRYRRSLKRKNFSAHTIKNYLNRIDHFTLWLPVPLNEVTRREMGAYVDHLLGRRLSAKTITCHLQTIRLFFDYLIDEEGMTGENPVRKISIRLSKPLPRHLKDREVDKLLTVITDPRDRAMVLLIAPLGPPGGRGCPSHRRCGRVPKKTGVRGQRKRRKGQGCVSLRRCPHCP